MSATGMSNFEYKETINDIIAKTVVKEEKREDGLTAADIEALRERFFGMSPDEIRVFIDCVPVEMCMDRIYREIQRGRAFEDSIRNVFDNMR